MEEIIIYTIPTCRYCRMAKEYFAKLGIPYKEYNVAEDEKAREEMVKKSHQLGVPVIEIGDHVFVGFDRAGIAEVLGIRK